MWKYFPPNNIISYIEHSCSHRENWCTTDKSFLSSRSDSVQVTSHCFGMTLSIIRANIDNSIQVQIPRKRSSQSFVTNIKCSINSNTTHDVLISKEIVYKSYKEICSGEPKKVNLGNWGNGDYFKVEDNSLVHIPRNPEKYTYIQ